MLSEVIDVQGEIFDDLKGLVSTKSLFKKRRGKWSYNQRLILEILADPMNRPISVAQIAKVTKLSMSYIYRLKRNVDFMSAVYERLKSSDIMNDLRAKAWRQLIIDAEKSPGVNLKLLEILGEYEPKGIDNSGDYSKLSGEEVAEGLKKWFDYLKKESDGTTGAKNE